MVLKELRATLTLREVPFSSVIGESFFLKSVLTVSDRVWQILIYFALEPTHESLFSFRNIGFRSFYSIYDAQRIIFLQLSKSSCGIQKRVLIFDIFNCFSSFSSSMLIKKLLVPSSIKLAIFRSLNKNLILSFSQNNFRSLNSLLCHLILSGIEFLHPCIRFGYTIIVFLSPKHDELLIIKCFSDFIKNIFNFSSDCLNFSLFDVIDGFDFLGWNFKVYLNESFICVPSFKNYLSFRNKVKNYIDNSNYGSKTKAFKLSPIILKWRFYNRFCNLSYLRNSLFFLQRRAFKIFNKEVKQDRFSTKRLLNKAFPLSKSLDKIFVDPNLFYSTSFYRHSLFFDSSFFCLYCGRLI